MDDDFRIRPVTEDDVDSVIAAAGGVRAHPDADRRARPGADYRLGEALIELKVLDDEGLAKPERQKKLAALFGEYAGERPVVVLDQTRLPAEAQPRYERILEGPIKNAVASARKQLKQSRAEMSDTRCSVLMMVNNGYTALNHEELLHLAAHRARHDTEEIDAVVVAGCYFHSDGFDSYFLWPIDCVPIRLERPFSSFPLLREAWNGLAQEVMTALMRGDLGPSAPKGPVVDTQFELDGVTYVKPAPPIGKESDFFRFGRPRKNSTGLESCPPVAVTFPDLTQREWRLFKTALPDEPDIYPDYGEWRTHRRRAAESGTPLKPFVAVPVTYADWEAWRAREQQASSAASLRLYANLQFDREVKAVIAAARERRRTSVLPHRYVLAVTEVIGQDRANDVSRIAYVRERPEGEPAIRPVVEDARIFHEHALALAAAYAVAERMQSVLWAKDLTYAWT